MKEKKIFENFQKFFCTQVKKISHFKHSLPPLIAWFKKIPENFAKISNPPILLYPPKQLRLGEYCTFICVIL